MNVSLVQSLPESRVVRFLIGLYVSRDQQKQAFRILLANEIVYRRCRIASRETPPQNARCHPSTSRAYCARRSLEEKSIESVHSIYAKRSARVFQSMMRNIYFPNSISRASSARGTCCTLRCPKYNLMRDNNNRYGDLRCNNRFYLQAKT